MDPNFYSILHVSSIVLLFGAIFMIAANPQPHKKKKMMAITGTLALIALVGGAGLLATRYKGYDAGGWTQGWVLVKLVVWFFLAGLAGMAFKKPKPFTISALVLSLVIAVTMVYVRPF